jgi:uncharacterized damage-inducible protein DinB
MQIDELWLLYDYNDWANHRVLEHVERLTPEQFHTPDAGTYGSIHETLVHMMDAEWSWAGVIWAGKGRDADWDAIEIKPEDYPDVAAIRSKWGEIEAYLDGFIANLTPDGENSPDQIVVWEGDPGAVRRRKLWPLMLHVVNHDTQHRSEVAAMLTRFGHSPGELDLTQYLRETLPEEPELATMKL